MNEPNTSKLAVLIDTDNASASNIEYLINEISRYGGIIVNRTYGDFTLPNNAQGEKFYKNTPSNLFNNSETP